MIRVLVLATIAATIAVALAATHSAAGYKRSMPLEIDHASFYAAASLADVRATPDNQQTLGCDIQTFPTSETLTCSGCNLTTCFWCYSYSPALIAAARAIQPSDYLTINWDPSGSGQCSWIYVGKFSMHAPLQP